MTSRDGAFVLTDEFADVLDRLHRGESLFLTGRAGTGKSTLIREFLATTDRNVVVVATTGIGALDAGGQTVHNLFSFGADVTVEQVRSDKYFPYRSAEALRRLDTLVIDEVSMLRADLFDCLAIALERFGPRRGHPLGGVQLVLVGDLFQLPPMVLDGEKDFFATRYESPYFFSADCYAYERFPTVELTRIFRQVGDVRLLEILDAVRSGTVGPRLLSELNARTDSRFGPPVDEFWLTLTMTDRSATRRNLEQLDRLAGPEIRHQATESGELEGFSPPTDAELVYKIGAQIMLLTDDPLGRWVDGTIGQVCAHRLEGIEPVVTVALPSGAQVTVRPHTWEMKKPVTDGCRLRSEVVGTFTQLPFELAWAVTIHKSQGQTLDKLVIDLTGDGRLYVALSRSTSMDGVVLQRPVDVEDLKTDPRVREFLRQRRPSTTSRGVIHLGV
ncbi:putative ATPase [Nocardia nova SH22a]|uniref:Putative ATPase n=1 Tax=Nocardia nova SH22a TaxID=1415166 RepID=W5TIH7_9NOCA|nr:AAA family ATPase [Nocardia nova]AHH17031.1 putative ATPase [Nocardia nova SH22a]